MVVQRVLNLSSVEASLIPQGVLPLCCDPERASILTIMQEVGASGEQAPRGHDGAGGSCRGEQSTPGGGRASGPRDGGPGSSRPADARGKRKQEGPPPPSPPEGAGRRVPSAGARRGPRRRRSPRGSGRRNGSARWGGQNHPRETSFPLQGGRLTDPLAGSSHAHCGCIHSSNTSFHSPILFVFWLFFCFSEIPSRPSCQSKSGQSEAENAATTEARRRESDQREAADRLREAEEAA